MDPVTAIVWICVCVFAVTSAITLLYLVGKLPRLREEHGKLLFKILVAEIVVAAVGAFTFNIHSAGQDHIENRIPLAKLMLIEQASPTTVYDDSAPIFLRAADVSRARREVDLQLDARSDFATAIHVQMKPKVPQEVTIGTRRYTLLFTHIGTIDPDPNERQAKDSDFAFLSFDRAKEVLPSKSASEERPR